MTRFEESVGTPAMLQERTSSEAPLLVENVIVSPRLMTWNREARS
jgi:hypothetical protein